MSPFVNKWENWAKWAQESFWCDVLFFSLKVKKIFIKVEERVCFMCLVTIDLGISYCIQFQLTKLQGAISLFWEFLQWSHSVLCHVKESWTELHCTELVFWNSAIWKKGLADYTLLAHQEKESEILPKGICKLEVSQWGSAWFISKCVSDQAGSEVWHNQDPHELPLSHLVLTGPLRVPISEPPFPHL